MAFNSWTAVSLVALILGIGFWAWMGLTYDNWTDVGVYSIGVTLIGFGAIGAWASMGDKTTPV